VKEVTLSSINLAKSENGDLVASLVVTNETGKQATWPNSGTLDWSFLDSDKNPTKALVAKSTSNPLTRVIKPSNNPVEISGVTLVVTGEVKETGWSCSSTVYAEPLLVAVTGPGVFSVSGQLNPVPPPPASPKKVVVEQKSTV